MKVKTYKWTKKLSLITPLLLIFAIVIVGGGHGYFEPLILIFPWASAGMKISNMGSICVFLFQFPIYGYLLDINPKNKIWIIATHIILSILILKFPPENWI